MYKHRITYASLQVSDPAFYVKVLYTIDIALQHHWKSCCELNDHQEVNDQVLMNKDSQLSILGYKFTQITPRSIMDKIDETEQKNHEKDQDKYLGQGQGLGNVKNKNKTNGDSKPIYNNAKNHKRWHLTDGRIYSKVFYPDQKYCPKSKDGKKLCMKFLIRGFCDSQTVIQRRVGFR